MLERHPDERGLIIQLFGDDPGMCAEAAGIIEERSACDGLDINFGCPVKKVARSGSGALLLDKPQLAREIVGAVRAVTTKPLSIKVRLGWSPSRPRAREFASIAADCGCSHITVHGRWAVQFYRGQADWKAVATLADIPVPVLVNGDVRTVEQARRALHESRAQGVAIGRGALARPDLFSELAGWPDVPVDSSRRRIETALELLRGALAGDQDSSRGAAAHVRLRSHLMYLMAGFSGASALRRRIIACESSDELVELLLAHHHGDAPGALVDVAGEVADME
jgi:tRNA-dihydrouridine synthase B